MGHRGIKMAMRDAHLAPDHLQAAVDALEVRLTKAQGKQGGVASQKYPSTHTGGYNPKSFDLTWYKGYVFINTGAYIRSYCFYLRCNFSQLGAFNL